MRGNPTAPTSAEAAQHAVGPDHDYLSELVQARKLRRIRTLKAVAYISANCPLAVSGYEAGRDGSADLTRTAGTTRSLRRRPESPSMLTSRTDPSLGHDRLIDHWFSDR